MMIRLPRQKYMHHVLSVATDISALQQILARGLPSLLLLSDRIILFPEHKEIPITQKQAAELSQCSNYDVLEISDNCMAFLYYNNRSKDNAIITTGKCNSNCLWCPTRTNARESGISAQISHLLDIVRHLPSDAPHMTITGGEPFLIGKDIFLLFDALKNHMPNTNFLLLTNGRVFCKKEYCESLEKTLPPHTVIGIPLHGYNQDTHDAITQAPGSFLQTYNGIHNLMKRTFLVEIRLVVSRLSANNLDRIAELITMEFPQVFSVKILGLEMLGSAAHHQDRVWIPYQQAFDCAKPAIDRLIEKGINVALYNFPLCSVNEAYWHLCYHSITDFKVRYPEECETCAMKGACGGIFAGTYRLAKGDIRVFLQER